MKRISEQPFLPELVNSGSFASERFVHFHSHPGTELVLITGGRCKMEVDGHLLAGGTGTLFILPAEKKHSQINDGLVRTIYLSFRRNSFFDENPRVIDITKDRWIKIWMKHIYLMHHRIQDGASGSISGILYSILTRIAELERGNKNGDSSHPALESALEYIGNHLSSRVNIDDIAKHCGISSSYLCALFQKQFSKGPVTVALELKLKYAKRLLCEPYLSVKETAESCGFGDANYFSRFFRKSCGCSPGEYRCKSLKKSGGI